MKKVYRKPDILFENFELSANIAGTCATEENSNLHASGTCSLWVTYSTLESCQLYDNGWQVFKKDQSGCVQYPQDDEYYGNLCYHNPGDNARLFTS